MAAYGSWKSPISAELVSSSQKRLEGLGLDLHHRLFWLESRPSQSGRVVLVREGDKAGDDPIDITPNDFSVQSTAQEYGGGAFCIVGASIVFSNFQDQRLYQQQLDSSSQVGILDSAPVPLTPDYGGPVVRYADGVFDLHFNRYVTVREDHRQSSSHPTSAIVAVGLQEGKVQEPTLLVSGNDFYAFPRVDPRGEKLTWIEWSHPNMPWDRAELWVGYISADGNVYKRICIAGGGDSSAAESPTEPKWSPNGELFFITDRTTGFWNIYKWIEQTNEVTAVYSLDAEFSRPLWVYGISSYDFVKSDEQHSLLACAYRQNGRSYVGIMDTVKASLSIVDVPFTDIRNVITGDHCLYIEAASAMKPLSLVKVTLDEKSQAIDYEIIWSCFSDIKQYEPYFSFPEFIKFPSEGGNQYAYAYFYPPCNPDYVAGEGEKPPLLLESHGGPTDEARGSLDLNIQYWTSRGWAFVDVNYGGSSGYGRVYRERLLGSWGIVDVDDCCSCAKFLVKTGKVDSERLCMTGCSAGGYTTLASLTFTDTFKAGASLFGVADLASLSAMMHKYESHYIRNLAGSEDALFNRSPINFVEKFSCPVILFQGLVDTVVHPEQARKIYSALKKKGLPVALVEYEGEPHGFRKAENLKFTLEQQMVFFARTIGRFNVADKISPIQIDNFD